jgi:acetyltransferase-like isoleucine patch superfamily enzyme
MNVLLITMAWPGESEDNLYTDLMLEFIEHGHQVTVAAINENKSISTYLSYENKIGVLRVKTGSIQKSNKYLKVVHSFMAGPKIYIALNKYLKHEKYDLILFSTPPITLTPFVYLLKLKHHAKLYLLLKDMWPQDAVDLKAMKKGSLVWTVFRGLEKFTYSISDYIGCMSPANVLYLKRTNTRLKNKDIEVCPNSRKVQEVMPINKKEIREKYNLPMDKKIFVYGGNLGLAQGVDFLLDIIQYYKDNPEYFFLIIGAGTEYNYLNDEIFGKSYPNAKIIPWLVQEQFLHIVSACDVGLILLNKTSTVPNFPSRLLTYLITKTPIIAAVDKATDIGDIIEVADCGVKAYHGDMNSFHLGLLYLMESEERRTMMGENGYQLFLEQYTTKKSYDIIMKHFLDSDANVHITEHYSLQIKDDVNTYFIKIKSYILTEGFKLLHFICYGDLSTSYYIKRGMKIGKNFYRQTATKFDPSYCFLIEIGNDVTIANNVQILAHDHSIRVYTGYGKVGKVMIGDNVFIGARVIILSSVVIGDNVIIGAGSIITKDIPSNSIVVGAPGKIINTTSEYVSRYKEELKNSRKFKNGYSNPNILTKSQKLKIKKACKDGPVYIKLGKVIEYGRKDK